MKKALFIILVAVFVAGAVFADHPSGFGIGVQFGGTGNWESSGVGYGAALTLKIPKFPIYWAVNMRVDHGIFGFGVAGDYYFIDNQIIETLHWYLGGGVGVDFGMGGDDFWLGVYGRLPVGISWQPLPLLELYLQIVPTLGVLVSPSFYFPYGGLGANLGIRLWF